MRGKTGWSESLMEKVCFLWIGWSLLSNWTLVCENITEASLFGIHVILWSMSTLDLKQDPPRRICTHVFAASHDATCSECYRGIWLLLSLPSSKMFFLPFRPHEMLQSLVHILQYFEQHYWHRNSNLSWINDWGLGQVSFNSTILESWLDSVFGRASIFRLFVFCGGMVSKPKLLPYGSGKASHTTSDETVVKRNTATSEESKQLIGFPSLSGATNFWRLKWENQSWMTIDQPWNSYKSHGNSQL